ncbi:MAG: hypothetical protein [Bacteriophage sp.]|nr:MAG: hypothetical protein [Bacteriophage sp.]
MLLCHIVPTLTNLNTFNTPLLLLNFHKNDVLNVSRGTVVTNVSRGTNEGVMLQSVSRGTLQVLTTVNLFF